MAATKKPQYWSNYTIYSATHILNVYLNNNNVITNASELHCPPSGLYYKVNTCEEMTAFNAADPSEARRRIT